MKTREDSSLMSLSETTAREWDLWQALRTNPRFWARLQELAGQSEFQRQEILRREFPRELVLTGLTLQDLRLKARGKFSNPENLWFDRVGLEQATGELVARHKAQRYHGRVWDYCCGIGSDAAALARQGCEVIAVDLNPLACLRAQWNAEVWAPERSVQFLAADVEQLTDRSGFVQIDPDRRVLTQQKAVRLEDYVPGREFLTRLTQEFAGGAIKLSPAANFGGKFPEAEVELISVAGECKEATIWFGTLRSEHGWRATVLPAGVTIAGQPLEVVADITPLGRYLYDPDPAVVRAGLVDHLAVELGLARLDAAEEYLTGDAVVQSPFVRGFEVQAEFPHQSREIKQHLRATSVGQLEIKCRHIPVQVDALRKQLQLSGTQAAVLIIARVEGKARGVVCRRCEGPLPPRANASL